MELTFSLEVITFSLEVIIFSLEVIFSFELIPLAFDGLFPLLKIYSHSIVPGGLEVISYVTLFMPPTSLINRVAVSLKNS